MATRPALLFERTEASTLAESSESCSHRHSSKMSSSSSSSSTAGAKMPTSTSNNNDAPHLWRRTRSLDDDNSHCRRINNHKNKTAHSEEDEIIIDENNLNDEAEEEALQQPLHSSFDAGLLENDLHSIFRVSKRRNSTSSAATASSTLKEDAVKTPHSSGRKHLRQPRAVKEEEEEMVGPGTVRKLARRNSNESAMSRQETPLRSVPPPPPTPTPHYHPWNMRNPRTGWKAPRSAAPETSSSLLFQPPLTPTANNASVVVVQPPTTQRLRPWESQAVPLETDSPSTTPFRFTSFPASLPRVHPPSQDKNNSNSNNNNCSSCYSANFPESVRKRLPLPPSAAAAAASAAQGSSGNSHYPNNPALAAATAAPTANNNHNHDTSLNQSREEDGTQNTSISSLSTHGGCDDDDELPSHHRQQHPHHHQRMPPVHTRLFLEEEYVYSDDDDDEEHEDALFKDQDMEVGRTRLDFNFAAPHSPKNLLPSKSTLREGGALAELAKRKGILNMSMQENTEEANVDPTDLTRPYEHKHVQSFPSIGTTSTAGLTGSGGHDTPAEEGLQGPGTPREVQLHFQLDNEELCSPIPGIPEEEELRPRPPLRTTKPASRLPPKPYPMDESHRHQPAQLKSHNNPHGHKQMASDDVVRTSFSTTGSVSSSNSAKLRRRPMPDMNAFEADNASRNGHDRSVDEASGDTSRQGQSPKLLCPPTPVRTPVWAHHHAKDVSANSTGASVFHRSNSLIVTRVLATCTDCAPEDSKIEAALADHNMEQAEVGPATATLQANNDVTQLEFSKKANPSDGPARVSLGGVVGSVISFSADFETLGILGRGAFADVYKVRSRTDNQLYAVKRNRRHFRGKRDRDIALAEVRSMQRLQQQSQQRHRNNYLQYLLFFYRAWQEDGHFFCQTELCCRDTCRELMDTLRSQWNVAKMRYPSLLRNLPAPNGVEGGSSSDILGRIVPGMTVWRVCHDMCAGLSHIHSRGILHNDIKPSNIFFVSHRELGCLCKIGDFGMAGAIGTSDDGQEGDQQYMAPELLSSETKQASSDIFSLGLTLYEVASDLTFELPKEGPRWHELRDGSHFPELPSSRGTGLGQLIKLMISPVVEKRPTAQAILAREKVRAAGSCCDMFLRDYIADLENYDRAEEEHRVAAESLREDQTPRNGGGPCRMRVCSPTFGQFPTTAPAIFTPEAQSR